MVRTNKDKNDNETEVKIRRQKKNGRKTETGSNAQ